MSCNAAPYLARGLHCTYISLVAEHLANPVSQLRMSLYLCMYISHLGTHLFHVLHIRANVHITCASVILRNVTAATAVLEGKRCSALANLLAVLLNILHAISPLPWGKYSDRQFISTRLTARLIELTALECPTVSSVTSWISKA